MQLLCGDCEHVMATLDAESVDAVVTDPPYGLRFMGRRWDYSVPGVDAWRECLRVLKPGGHLLCFAGARTYHRMACNIEDAGFEIRDMLAWVYSSGFPTSLDISKAIDKLAGAEREVVGNRVIVGASASTSSGGTHGHGPCMASGITGIGCRKDIPVTVPATPSARQWNGWGTALKPAHEPIALARKPFKGTVAENVLEHGTGGLNIDGCLVESDIEEWKGREGFRRICVDLRSGKPRPVCGRWPANFIHDGSQEVSELLPYSGNIPISRFFYCVKANKTERGEGNTHPTVKPVNLMRWLVRLVTPPDGILLDPYMGSGSTGVACAMEGFDFTGIEQNPEWVAIAEQRIGKVAPLFNTERITA